MLLAVGLFGSLGQQVEDLSRNPRLVETLTGSAATAWTSPIFFAAAMALLGAISAGYPLQALLRMRAEESEGRLESILATASGRAG